MSYGINRMIDDLGTIGYNNLDSLIDSDNQSYAVIRNFVIGLGQFSSRVIDLAIPVPTDYPRTVGASIHIVSS